MALLQAQPLPHTGSYSKNLAPLSLTHLSYRDATHCAKVSSGSYTYTALSQEGPCGPSGSNQLSL